MNTKRNILLNPGPVTTTDSVKMSMVVPDICPREKEFVDILTEVREGLLEIAGADDNNYTSILIAGSGTAVMDSVINSTVPQNKKIMIINNGAYGERMVKIAKAYNIKYVELKFSWTESLDLNVTEKALNLDHEITHVAMVHHETTTGLLNPLREMGKLVKGLDKVFIVDAISSFAAIPIDIKSDKIDYLMSTSNKCIQGMPGISFVIAKKNELEKTANIPPRSFYLNLFNQYKYFEDYGEMQFTPPVQIVYALRQAIKEYQEEGGANRYKRYIENWKILTKGLKKMGFILLLDDSLQSYILTTVIEPDHPNYEFKKLHDILYDKGFTIYPGKIGIKNTFRIANMGAIDQNDITNFLTILDETLKKLQIDLFSQKELRK